MPTLSLSISRDEFEFRYWKYYLFLERNFIKTLDYVEFDVNNFKTYSSEFCKDLFVFATEAESLFKLILVPII